MYDEFPGGVIPWSEAKRLRPVVIVSPTTLVTKPVEIEKEQQPDEQSKPLKSAERKLSYETRKRAKLYKDIKDRNPSFTLQEVADAANRRERDEDKSKRPRLGPHSAEKVRYCWNQYWGPQGIPWEKANIEDEV